MANFDVLSGRLLLDTSEFVRGLQQASAAAQLFTQSLGANFKIARRDLDQLSASQAMFAASARSLPRSGAASPWSALFAGPAAAFNSSTGNTSQAALMGFVERVNQSLSRQANLADQLTEAVDRVRIAVEERARPGREIHDQFKEAADTVVDLLKKASESIEATLDKLVDKAREAAEEIGDLNDKLGELADKSKDADDKVDGLNDKLKDFADKCENAADKLEELGKKLENVFSRAGLGTGGAGAGGSGSAFAGGAGAVVRPIGDGPAAQAGGFAPLGERGQAPLPTLQQILFDQVDDRFIGGLRAAYAAGPELKSEKAKGTRQEMAHRDLQRNAALGRNVDDLHKLENEALDPADRQILTSRRIAAEGEAALNLSRSISRTKADNATTNDLGPKNSQRVRAELAIFNRDFKQSVHEINRSFKNNPPADKEEQESRKKAQQQLNRQGQFVMKLLRDVNTKSGKEREDAIQEFIKARRLFLEMGDTLRRTDIDFKQFDETAKEANKQEKEHTRVSKDAEQLEEKKAARLKAEEQAAEQHAAANEIRGAGAPGQQAQQQVQNWWNNQVQQAQQQFQQWPTQMLNQMQQAGQQAMQQAGQQAWDSGQAMLEQAIGGPEQVQAMIDQATATGHKSDAIRLIRQRIEAQLEQSKLNLHNLASDPAAGGGFGSSHGGVSNDAYFMTLDIPLVRLIKFLQSQLDALPKMAAGGIVTGPTSIVAGEAGPEAVLPLTSFANMLGSLPVFSNIHDAMESISESLAAQGRTGQADRWDKMLDRVQSSFEYVSNFVENSRRIDLTPQGMLRPLTQGMLMDQEMAARNQAYRIGGLSTGDLALHFHGVDISNPGAARQFAQQLLPALENEARSLGQDMTGRSVFRSPSLTGAGTPGRPYGFAR